MRLSGKMFHYLSFRFRIAALVINHVKYTWEISGPEKEMAQLDVHIGSDLHQSIRIRIRDPTSENGLLCY